MLAGFSCSYPSPLTPHERRTSWDLKDVKDDASVSGSDVVSDLNPPGLSFAKIQHNLNTNSLNSSRSSTSSILFAGTVTVGASIQRSDFTARLQYRDSRSVTGHGLHCCGSSSHLQSLFTSMSTRTEAGPINPPTSPTTPAASFGSSQSLILGTRPDPHLRSSSSPNGEAEERPVVGLGSGTISDDMPKSSAKRV